MPNPLPSTLLSCLWRLAALRFLKCGIPVWRMTPFIVGFDNWFSGYVVSRCRFPLELRHRHEHAALGPPEAGYSKVCVQGGEVSNISRNALSGKGVGGGGEIRTHG